MDVKYIKPFVAATQTVFKTMLNMEPRMGKPILKDSGVTSGDVTGIMGLTGDKLGSVCVSFGERGAVLVYNALMGDDHDTISPEVIDAIGEFTNIIAGQARKEFEKAGINLKAALPTVVVGRGVEMHSMSKLPTISLPFSFSSAGVEEAVRVDFAFE
jgi:chemotaxis protein CheX